MPDSGAEGERREAEGESPEVLRAKYHDYCSAQLADILIYLSPDEIFLLAQKVAAEKDVRARMSYSDMVAFATEWLSRKVALPPFDVWLEDYLEHPRRYEEYLMGLWRSDLKVPSDG